MAKSLVKDSNNINNKVENNKILENNIKKVIWIYINLK